MNPRLRKKIVQGFQQTHVIDRFVEQVQNLQTQQAADIVHVLTAMNTGHDGSMSTVHANNAQDALLRLETLVGLTGRQIAERTLRQMICAALDVVIQLTRLPDGRRCVSEVVEEMSVVMMLFLFPALLIVLAGPGFTAIGRAFGS